MAKHLLDAVKTATEIHNGDYSSLRGKSFVTCDKMKKNKWRGRHVKKSKEGRVTLSKLTVTVKNLATTVNDLSTTVNDLSATVNDLSTTVNDLSTTVNDLAKEMRAGFKQVNSRIDNLEKRIDARLDYNGLKKLPEDRLSRTE